MSGGNGLLERLKAFEGREVGAAEVGPDPVNQPMIRHWVEAIGDENPVYRDAVAAEASVHGGIVAPPVMLQAWVMRGLHPRPAGGTNPREELMGLLNDAGFTSVVATNCEQEYHRYVRPGDHLRTTTVIDAVSSEKKTALGAGHFVTTCVSYHDQHGELVGTMRFRILKFKPGPAKTARPKRPRPAITQDNAFFFEGAKQGKLLIQRCASCGRLRHPPRPMCNVCGSLDWDTVEASGRGVVYSFVVNHHPQVPAFDYPLVVALVELEEGTRLVSNIVGVDAGNVHVGMQVELEFVAFDDDLTLPQFHPRVLDLMDFTFTEEQEAVRDLADTIIAGHAPVDRVKDVEASAERFDRALWSELAASNLLGIALPDDVGGSGLGIIELCLLLEQQGRRVAPVPLWPTLVLGALPIAEFGSAEQRSHWLPSVAAGDVVLTAALESFGPDPTAHSNGASWTLDGTRLSVPFAHVAARVLVPARTDDGLRVFLLDPRGEGVELQPAEATNREIRTHLILTGAPAEMLGGDGVVEWLHERALVGLCALQLGVCEEALRITADYTSNRMQFGRPLSTFQGVALKAADGYIDTEAMRATLWQAAWRLTERLDASREVMVAKWWAADGGQRVVHTTQHLHGGLGADVDYPVHRYFLWGLQLSEELGGASAHLARLGAAIAEAGA